MTVNSSEEPEPLLLSGNGNEKLSTRWGIVILCFLAVFNAYQLRANLSIAITGSQGMAHDEHWDHSA